MHLILELVFGLSLALMLYISWLMFRDLADLSQWVVRTSRKKTMWTFYNRHRLAIAFGALWAVAALTLWVGQAGNLIVFLVCSAIGLFGFGVGYINPRIMMRSQHHDARYYSLEEAKEVLKPDTSLIVVETQNGARGHPDGHIMRPHVAGLTQDNEDENVVLTYCGLTNLGVAYVPEIDGKQLDLQVMTQLENNLVLWDRNSGEPIQQLWGRKEIDGPSGSSMPERPSYRMPLWAFEKTFPDGKVFLNPIVSVWKNPFLSIYDRIISTIFAQGVIAQEKIDGPVFPTIEHFDDRLPNKAKVYAANVGDDYVAWTEEFIREQGDLLNVKLGDQDVVVAYHPDVDSIGMYVNDTGRPVHQIAFGGDSDQGLLRRLETMKAAAYWVIWQNFFPKTAVNRAPATA